jgi:Beta/Gamma crystallin
MPAQRPSPLRRAALAAAMLTALAAQAAPLEIYEQPDFQGMALGLDRPQADLGDYGFENKAQSVVVRRGRWELCSEPGFRGNCVVLDEGRHASLPRALQRRVSSARPQGDAMGTGPADAAVVLYDEGDFRGRSLAVNGSVPSLGKLDMGDRVSSAEVRRGVWQLCEDSNYQGQCTTLEPGRHHIGGRLHDEASSIRPLFGPDRQPLPASGGITLYQNADFSGRSLLITGPTEYLGRLGFGDMASSVDVHDGLWEVCTDSVYKGRCITHGPGRHVLSGNTHDRASSVRPQPRRY